MADDTTPCFVCGQPKPQPADVCASCHDDPVAYTDPRIRSFTEEVRSHHGPGSSS